MALGRRKSTREQSIVMDTTALRSLTAYFRMWLFGYFERIESEPRVAWRSADSLALKDFLGIRIQKSSPALQQTVAAVQNILTRVTTGPTEDVVVDEVVLARGYHHNSMLVYLQQHGIRSCVAAPNGRPRRWKKQWDAHQTTYASRRRVRGELGTRLQRKRGAMLNRTLAHPLASAMHGVHLRHRQSILNLLIHVRASNLSLFIRHSLACGTNCRFVSVISRPLHPTCDRDHLQSKHNLLLGRLQLPILTRGAHRSPAATLLAGRHLSTNY